jgi:hypothetical protein
LTKNPDAMISALRKIENRGELPGATSAVMELCVDNPREGFADLFATHPSVDARVQALVKFAGGHDPGRLAPDDPEDLASASGSCGSAHAAAATRSLGRRRHIAWSLGPPLTTLRPEYPGRSAPVAEKPCAPLTTLRHDRPTGGLMN